jgi:hypothetical protein
VINSRREDQWGARMAALKDPDGNNLYLLQRLQKPARDTAHHH